MNQDENNLNLLSIFHYIVGALTILGSSIFIGHIILGIAILHGVLDGQDAPPRAFGWMFIVVGAMAVLFGWALGILMIIAGMKLKKHVARTFCLVIAGIECIIIPFGTVLGVLTIVTLMKESVIKLFEQSAPGACLPEV